MLVDYFKLPNFPVEAITSGNCTSLTKAAASAIATQKHDRLMQALDQQPPTYGFATGEPADGSRLCSLDQRRQSGSARVRLPGDALDLSHEILGHANGPCPSTFAGPSIAAPFEGLSLERFATQGQAPALVGYAECFLVSSGGRSGPEPAPSR